MSSAAATLDRDELARWLVARRWFGSKSREPAGVEVLDSVPLDSDEPRLELAMVEVRFAAGAPETYQVPISVDSGERSEKERIASLGDEPGAYAYDALAGRRDANRLLALIVAGGEAASAEGRVAFAWIADPPPPGLQGRPISAEQSNSSVVFGENAILKAYRRLEDGTNPELEMLRFLGARGFRQIPTLYGWYEYRGAFDATLGVVGEFIADGRDGWELTLDGLSGDADSLLDPLRDLGATVGAMHTALAGDPTDPAFAPEELDGEAVARFTERLEAEVERLFGDLGDDERLAPIARRGKALRHRLRGLREIGGGGMAIRVHGDLHLGQTLRSDRGWTLLDFEGEPARPLPERRAKQSPLRDVAGLLRSFAYAPAAARLQRGAEPPEDWEDRARERFLDGYRDAVDPSLLPASRRDVDGLLALHELEKAVYELRYELDNRPDWVPIPVAGITRLLEVQVA